MFSRFLELISALVSVDLFFVGYVIDGFTSGGRSAEDIPFQDVEHLVEASLVSSVAQRF